ncbi:glycosyltransferase [Candidatus Bathyarchaeota archaeon]|nr:glycosyltransferase [Candidatus Bathyarchaeota archaeon]
MRVLFGCDYFHPIVGGGEEWNKQVAFRLNKKGHDVTVLTYKVPGYRVDSILNGVKIRRMGPCIITGTRPYLRRALVQGLGVFHYVLKNHDEIDVIQTQAFPLIPSYFALRILRYFGWKIPLTVVWHDVYGFQNNFRFKGFLKGFIRYITELSLLRLSRYASLVITVSESTKRKLIHSGIPSEKIRVVYGGVDLNDFEGIESDDPKNNLLYVGRIVPEKRVEDLLEAFKLLLAEESELNLVIVGSGNWMDNLKAHAKYLGIDDRVNFTGFVSNSEKIKLIKESMFLVLPSLMEGLGLVLLEAMACGKPVIAINRGGPREVIEHGVNGFLVEPCSSDSLFEFMLRLVRDAQLREKMGGEGKRLVKKKFTWGIVADRVEEALVETLS